MKHVLQVRDLALQQWIADGRLTLQKIASSGNVADLLTKTCVPECTPVSHPETWSSTVTSRQYVCWNVMWADGRNGTPVYWYMDRWKERCTCVFGWISRRLECAC